jgi:hypothetical protein
LKPKFVYLIAFLLGVVCTIIGLVIASHYHPPASKPLLTNNEPIHPTNEPLRQPTPPVTQPAAPVQSIETVTAPVRPPETQPSKSSNETAPKRPAVTSVDPPIIDSRLNDPVVKEELGRYALNFVGDDPVANELWATLIYDTSLPDKVREDLMEDLNENGFSGGDGSVPTVQDLPLIASRIAMLEDHMQGADEFMMEHLGEAHKDLVNMWFELRRQ